MEKLRLIYLQPHRFENIMMRNINVEDSNQHNNDLVTLLEVYVEDFIALSNDIRHTHIMSLSHAMLHGIHEFFSPPEVTGHNGFDPIALKKCKMVMEYGTITRKYWDGILMVSTTPLNYQLKITVTYAPSCKKI